MRMYTFLRSIYIRHLHENFSDEFLEQREETVKSISAEALARKCSH